MDARARSTLVWLVGVTLAAAVVTLVALGGGELRPHDEGLYGKLARNAAAHGVYLHAVDASGAYTPEFSKPPLSIALVAASYGLFGHSLWALRLPFALGSIGCALVCFFWGARIAGPRLGGLWALSLLACESTLRWGRAACIEPLFVGFCLLGLSAYGQALSARGRAAVGWATLAGLGLALAGMTKQLAVGLAVLPIVALELARREGWRRALPRLSLALGLPAVTLGTWFWLAYAKVGAPLWEAYVSSSVLARLRGYDSGRHQRTLNEVSGLLAEVVSPFPWALGLCGLALWLLATRRAEQASGARPGQAWLLGGYFAAAVLLYENASGSLLPWYVFALVPPVAGGVGWGLFAATSAAEGEAAPLVRAGAAVGALALLVAALASLGAVASQLDVAIALLLAGAALAGAGGRWLSRGTGVMIALGFAAIAAGIARRPDLYQEPGRYEALMIALDRRGVSSVAVDRELGIGGNQYGTYFGPGAERVKQPPWSDPAAGSFAAYVTDAVVPEELAPPAGVELVRAPGAVAWIGDLGRAPWSTESLRGLLAAGPVTFEAEHLRADRADTRIDDASASGGQARALRAWRREAIERHALIDGPHLAFPSGRHAVTVRARWDCEGVARRVGVIEVYSGDDRRGALDLGCETGDSADWTDATLPVTLGQGRVLRVRVIHERGALAVDRVAVARAQGGG